MSELTPDDLFKAWKFQDEFSEIALKMIEAGIDLGVKAAGIEIMKLAINKDYQPLEVDDYEKAMSDAAKSAKENMKERLKDVRGS